MRSDRWFGPVIILLGVVWMWLVYKYIPGAQNVGEPGPRGFPIVLGISLLGIGILITISAYRPGRKAESGKSVTRREAIIVAGTFGLLMLYAFLMEKAGFLIATPIAVLLMMYGILRMRNWLLMLLMAVGVTTFCWLFFVLLLKTPMPHGSWLWLMS